MGNADSVILQWMETGEPWNQLTALDADTQRAQVYEKPLVPDFHGVSTEALFFGPPPIPDEHSIESWTHVLPVPCPENHSRSPDSWQYEQISRVSKKRNTDAEQKRRGGRPKGITLTEEKRKTTRAVRQAGSCWPCFLKKIKVLTATAFPLLS